MNVSITISFPFLVFVSFQVTRPPTRKIPGKWSPHPLAPAFAPPVRSLLGLSVREARDLQGSPAHLFCGPTLAGKMAGFLQDGGQSIEMDLGLGTSPAACLGAVKSFLRLLGR